jgi:hypothetical protein
LRLAGGWSFSRSTEQQPKVNDRKTGSGSLSTHLINL